MEPAAEKATDQMIRDELRIFAADIRAAKPYQQKESLVDPDAQLQVSAPAVRLRKWVVLKCCR